MQSCLSSECLYPFFKTKLKLFHLLRYLIWPQQFSSVQFSHSVVSDSLRLHEPQHVRPPCPSPTPGVHSDSRPSSQWCHLTISSSVVPFSSFLRSFPTSGLLGSVVQNSPKRRKSLGKWRRARSTRLCVLWTEKHLLPLVMLGTKI